MGIKVRLDKYLSDHTELSRREAKAAVRKGRVSVDGETALHEEVKVLITQKICIDGREVKAEQYAYYMMNKPAGVVSATRDERECTVCELMEGIHRELFPIGRLDKDTEGLLLLTDDGALAHRLLSPKYHVEKTYYIEYEGLLTADAEVRFAEGVDIGEKKITRPARLKRKQDGQAFLTISEGKFHQVKRMIACVGGRVTYLKRLSMAGLMLDNRLAAGEYRRLLPEEAETLRRAAERGDGQSYGKEELLCGKEREDTGNLPDMGGV